MPFLSLREHVLLAVLIGVCFLAGWVRYHEVTPVYFVDHYGNTVVGVRWTH